MKFRPIIQLCVDEGWEANRINGGHLIMTKKGCRSIPIPIHGEGIDIDIIRKQINQDPPRKASPALQIITTDKENVPPPNRKQITKVESHLPFTNKLATTTIERY